MGHKWVVVNGTIIRCRRCGIVKVDRQIGNKLLSIEAAAEKVLELLTNLGFESGKDPFRHVLLLMLTSAYKMKVVREDMSNEHTGELIIVELNTYLKSNFGLSTTRAIMRSVFLTIARLNMFLEPGRGNKDKEEKE